MNNKLVIIKDDTIIREIENINYVLRGDKNIIFTDLVIIENDWDKAKEYFTINSDNLLELKIVYGSEIIIHLSNMRIKNIDVDINDKYLNIIFVRRKQWLKLLHMKIILYDWNK